MKKEKQPTSSESVRKVRVGGLKNLSSVRSELARIYRDCRQGKLESSEGTKLTYILVNLAKIIEQDDIEKRVTRLEGIIFKNKNRGANNE